MLAPEMADDGDAVEPGLSPDTLSYFVFIAVSTSRLYASAGSNVNGTWCEAHAALTANTDTSLWQVTRCAYRKPRRSTLSALLWKEMGTFWSAANS
jgi:hypothetical protein